MWAFASVYLLVMAPHRALRPACVLALGLLPALPSALHVAMSAQIKTFKAEWNKLSASASSSPLEAWPGHCMPRANRTLWFFGNSVSRIHYFALLALLSGGTAKSIEEQVAMCGRGGEWHGRRPGQGVSCLGPCSCFANVPGGRLAFVWQQRLYHTADELITGLNGMRHHANATINIRRGDLILVNAGLDDVTQLAKRASGKKRTLGPDGKRLPANFTYFHARWLANLNSAAPRLAEAMTVAWRRGRPVFWRSSTPVCHTPNHNQWGLPTGPGLPEANVNDLLTRSDGRLRAEMVSRGVPVIDTEDIDREAIPPCPAGTGGATTATSSTTITTATTAIVSATTSTVSTASSSCRCQGYLADHTNIHPAPLVASKQIRLMLRLMSDACRRQSQREKETGRG